MTDSYIYCDYHILLLLWQANPIGRAPDDKEGCRLDCHGWKSTWGLTITEK